MEKPIVKPYNSQATEIIMPKVTIINIIYDTDIIIILDKKQNLFSYYVNLKDEIWINIKQNDITLAIINFECQLSMLLNK